MYSAKIIADSISPTGVRLTSIQVTIPRFILPEMTRHRIFSFSVQSSRAIPTAKLIEQVRENPVTPLHWGKNQPGMTANEELTGEHLEKAKKYWEMATKDALIAAQLIAEQGGHKQIVNRILEPYSWTTALISSTEWDNFFDLRISDAAQPEIRRIAELMKFELYCSEPEKLEYYQYHLPYIEPKLKYDSNLNLEQLKNISSARCARLSTLTFEGKRDLNKDLELSQKLIRLKHWSPLEAVATPYPYVDPTQTRNYTGWKSYRAEIETP